MRNYVHTRMNIILVYCGECRVWFNECVHVFLTRNFLLGSGIDVVR
jgi:hypothetical protein